MVYRVMKSNLFDALPELGIGFQFGVHSRTGEGLIVLNAEYAISAQEVGDPNTFRRLDEAEARADIKEKIEKADIQPSQDVGAFLKSFGSKLSNESAYRNRKKLHESPPFAFRGQGNFVRYSAFKSDRRVGDDGSLRPGTYVTGEMDAKLAITGYGNVGRYAMPNLLPAHYRFAITIKSDTSGWVGTVAPAFGQAGGGAEIELTESLPPGSVQLPPKTIPDY